MTGELKTFRTVITHTYGLSIASTALLYDNCPSDCVLTLYVTRHDILCPNAVKRDVGKTRCKSDVIYATALCCAICTLLTSFRAKWRKHFVISSQRNI